MFKFWNFSLVFFRRVSQEQIVNYLSVSNLYYCNVHDIKLLARAAIFINLKYWKLILFPETLRFSLD